MGKLLYTNPAIACQLSHQGETVTEVPPENRGKTRVLIIDDNEALSEIAKLMLEHMGRIVHTAATGAEGRSLAVSFQPDVVVCDINLPDETGYEVLANLRASTTGASHPPFVFLTGGPCVDTERCQRLGAAAVLTKPCALADLNGLLGQLHDSAVAAQRKVA